MLPSDSVIRGFENPPVPILTILHSLFGDPMTNTSWVDPISMKYHLDQWEVVKESTKHFSQFIKNKLEIGNYLEIGCGAGAPSYFIAKQNPQCKFIATDNDSELVNTARTIMANQIDRIKNLDFEVDDWFNLKRRENINGVLSMQTISWIEEYAGPMTEIFNKINPNWIAISGLFYEGDIDCKIEVTENIKKRSVFYNTYSIPSFDRFCNRFGYRVTDVTNFDIDISINKPKDTNIMGTYTRKVLDDQIERNLQISGPLLLNWKFILIEK